MNNQSIEKVSTNVLRLIKSETLCTINSKRDYVNPTHVTVEINADKLVSIINELVAYRDAPEKSEMLKKAHSLSEEIGELIQEIDSAGGYNFEALQIDQDNSPVIPAGWKLVPVEATPHMLRESYRLASVHSQTAYKAMIAAAPAPEK